MPIQQLLGFRLVDGEALQATYPETKIPSRAVREYIEHGDFVKIGFEVLRRNDPRFREEIWVDVGRSGGGRYQAVIPIPPYNVGVVRGVIVEFGPEHVLAIADEEYKEERLARLELNCRVSRRVHDDGVRPHRVEGRDPVGAKDESGYLFLAGDEDATFLDDPRNFCVLPISAVIGAPYFKDISRLTLVSEFTARPDAYALIWDEEGRRYLTDDERTHQMVVELDREESSAGGVPFARERASRDQSTPMDRYRLIDGEALSLVDSVIPIPSRAVREYVFMSERVQIGFYVTRADRREHQVRIWVKARPLRGGALYSAVIDEAPCGVDVRNGEEVKFGPEHILAMEDEELKTTLLEKLQQYASVSRRVREEGGPPGRVEHRMPGPHGHPTEWVVLAGDEDDAFLEDPKNFARIFLKTLLDAPYFKGLLRFDLVTLFANVPPRVALMWDEEQATYLIDRDRTTEMNMAAHDAAAKKAEGRVPTEEESDSPRSGRRTLH